MRWWLVVALVAACGRQPNAEYCASALHASEPFCKQSFPDAGVDAAIRCSVATSGPDPVACAKPPTLICDLQKNGGECVQCIDDGINSTACSGNSPICDRPGDYCRACTGDNECLSSHLCLPTGACAMASDVAYALGNGTANANGGCPDTTAPAMACNLTQALKTSKKYIKATGAFNENITLDNGVGTRTIYGSPGTTLAPAGGGPTIKSTGSTVDIWDFELVNGQAGGSMGVVTVMGGTLGLHRLNIHGPSQMLGVVVTGGGFTMERSTVASFASGGVQIANGAGPFNVTNNFIVHNGTSGNGSKGSSFGAVLLEVQPPGSQFAWNTVADNGSSSKGSPAGIACTGGSAGIDGAGNLLFNNDGGQYTQSCGFSNTLVTTTDPRFVDPSTNNYRLTAQSLVAIDAAGKLCVPYDIYGNSRPFPSNGACDFGAHEYRP